MLSFFYMWGKFFTGNCWAERVPEEFLHEELFKQLKFKNTTVMNMQGHLC